MNFDSSMELRFRSDEGCLKKLNYHFLRMNEDSTAVSIAKEGKVERMDLVRDLPCDESELVFGLPHPTTQQHGM